MSLEVITRMAGTGVLLLSALGFGLSSHLPAVHAAPAISGLHVEGNRLVNDQGQTVVLHGVNRSGTEYACVQGWGIFNGPSDEASVQAIASWNVNVVRVPLNEDCWLGINGVNPAYSGAVYRQAIVDYVDLLNQNGMAAIVDLHWSAPGAASAQSQLPMPDQDHAIDFWQSVATTFKNNQSVIFDLFNEPYPDNNQDTTSAWLCWRDGGACPGADYQVAGMQTLVDTVRAMGATNVLMLGGVQYANALSQWLAYEPDDPLHNLAASWHSYNGQQCQDANCWDSIVAPVAAQVPLITGEIGEDDCAHGYIDGLMNWLDGHGASYLAWSWNTTDNGTCHSGDAASIAVLEDYNGTPMPGFGQGYHDHLAALAASPAAAPQFSDDTSASPAIIPAQGTTTIQTTVTATGADLSDGIVDIEVYDAAGNQVAQQYFEHQSIPAGTATSYSFAWTAPDAAGIYTVEVGIFSSDWATNYYWDASAASVNVA